MEKIKINPTDKYESIKIILDENKYPIAHQMKLEELMEQGTFGSEAEAVEEIPHTLCSPYTKAEFE